MASFTGVLNRIRGITHERIAEAMEELRISEKFKDCIKKINLGRPQEAILAANEANKELASWAGIDRNELSSLQNEEFMSNEQLKEGVEGINRKAMRCIHRKISGIKSIRRLEKQDEGLLIKITRQIRKLSDLLVEVERAASDLTKKEEHEIFKFLRELDAVKEHLNSALHSLSKHVGTLKRIYTMERKLVPAPA
jgi:glutaredoxin 2